MQKKKHQNKMQPERIPKEVDESLNTNFVCKLPPRPPEACCHRPRAGISCQSSAPMLPMHTRTRLDLALHLLELLVHL